MLAGLPVDERRLSLEGASTTLLEGGAGPSLVLLHGGIECGGAYWAPVVPRLARAHRVVIPDVPGLGESAPLSRLDGDSLGAWLEALVDVTCEEAPVLVAHSLTASLAAQAVAARPGLVRRVVIYASPAIGRYRMPLRLRSAAMRFALRPTEANMRRFARFALLDAERVRARNRAWFDAFVAFTAARAREARVKRTMRTLVATGTARIADERLLTIDAPAGLLWGRRDRMTPLGLGERASGRLGWPLQVVDDAAHVPHIEQPDAFVAALEALLRP